MRNWQRAVLAGLLWAGCSAKPTSETPPARAKTDDAAVAKADDTAVAKAATGWKAKLPSVTKLVYHFQDSSVPPQYHRSVTLTVTPNKITKVVDSYGDIVSEQSNAITASQFQDLLATMDGLGIGLADGGARAEGCSGGTSDSLSLYAGTSEVLSASASSCGGDTSGVLQGDVKQLARNASGLLVPNADGPTAQ